MRLFPAVLGAQFSAPDLMGSYMTEQNLGNTTLSEQCKANLFYRPRCPQPFCESDPWLTDTFPPSAREVEPCSWDDLACTNLNITFPVRVLNGTLSRLPVIVYIHGAVSHLRSIGKY